MLRRFGRALWPLTLFALVFSWRALGCQRKEPPKPHVVSHALPTSRFTAPPPRPTTTMWPGATRVPALPE